MQRQTRNNKPPQHKASNFRSRLAVNALGTLGAFLLTYAVSYALVITVFWIAQRFVSLGSELGSGLTALLALVLTGVFYWYDRANS